MNELRRFEPPRASDALRARVLARAKVAVASAAAPSRADRIWYSRRWRLAWAGAIAALALTEVVALRAVARPARPTPAPAVLREADAAAAAVGLQARSWIGARVVSGDEVERRAMEGSL